MKGKVVYLGDDPEKLWMGEQEVGEKERQPVHIVLVSSPQCGQPGLTHWGLSSENLCYPWAGEAGGFISLHSSWVEGCPWGLTPGTSTQHCTGRHAQGSHRRETCTFLYLDALHGNERKGIKSSDPQISINLPLGYYLSPILHPCGFAGTILVFQVQVLSMNGSETGICFSWPVRAHPATSRTRGKKLSTGIVQPPGCGPQGGGE